MKTILSIILLLFFTLSFTDRAVANEVPESQGITILFIGSFIDDIFPFDENKPKSALLRGCQKRKPKQHYSNINWRYF